MPSALLNFPKRMSVVTVLLTMGLFMPLLLPFTSAQEVALGDVAERAVGQSKLTTQGGAPFHLQATIAEKESSNSDYKADVQIDWMSPQKWRLSVQSPGFSQILTVNEDKTSEQDIGDYYPVWLHELVTAMLDPLPMLESLKRSNTQIRRPMHGEQSVSCTPLQAQVGIPPAVDTVFYVFCFEDSHGLLTSVTTPGYAVSFENYKTFKDKRVAQLLVINPEPGTTIEARITKLTDLTSSEEQMFAVSEETPREKRLQSAVVSEVNLRSMALQNPEIVWPSVRTGKTSGVLSMYVSVDKLGHVRETFPLNSSNPNLNDPARQQVQKWRFQPAVSKGVPVQLESILTFAFKTKVEDAVPVLSDAEVRKLATNIVEATFPPGTPRGSSISGRVPGCLALCFAS